MATKPLVSVAFKKKADEQSPLTILAGDVGGTKTNMALFRADQDGVVILHEKRYVSKDYKALDDILQDFMEGKNPDRICAAVAGPVLDGKSHLTNLSWQMDSAALSERFKIPVGFINDLEATAYGLAGLKPEERVTLQEGDTEHSTGNIAIIAPGTGLGEAGMFWDGQGYHPFPTEGGHSDFAPRTEEDIEFFRYLQKQFGHVSWERAVSGMGIKNIFHFLIENRKQTIPDWLRERMEKEDLAAIISDAAMKREDSICTETMELFVRYLATESSSLVLKHMATGGLYIGGGIPPKILPLLQSASWSDNFDNNGRMHALSDRVPIHVVLNDKMALMGAAYYGAYNM